MTSRLARLISMDAYIRRGGYPTVEKLSRMFDIQPRTAYQDLRELREKFGFAIRFDPQHKGYYNADPNNSLPALTATQEEIMLLLAALEMLSHFVGPSLKGALVGIVLRLCDQPYDKMPHAIEKGIAFLQQLPSPDNAVFLEAMKACIAENPLGLEHGEAQPGRTFFERIDRLELAENGWRLRGVCDHGTEVLMPLTMFRKVVSTGKCP